MNSYLFFLSAVTVGYIRYQHTLSLKSYNLKIESLCFLLVAVSTKNISIQEKDIMVCFYHKLLLVLM